VGNIPMPVVSMADSILENGTEMGSEKILPDRSDVSTANLSSLSAPHQPN
jgi:hypothetical protein